MGPFELPGIRDLFQQDGPLTLGPVEGNKRLCILTHILVFLIQEAASRRQQACLPTSRSPSPLHLQGWSGHRPPVSLGHGPILPVVPDRRR